jgi:hypothetical protein
MIGPEKVSEIRAHVRKSFKMTDSELLSWFNQQIVGAGKKNEGNPKAIETLRLFRDALVKESQSKGPKPKARLVARSPK